MANIYNDNNNSRNNNNNNNNTSALEWCYSEFKYLSTSDTPRIDKTRLLFSVTTSKTVTKTMVTHSPSCMVFVTMYVTIY
jgi:hypothetical protein